MPQNIGEPLLAAYNHITNAGTFVIKAAPGGLFSLNINSATAGGTLELFDQSTTATGTVVIAGPITLGTLDVLPMRVLFGPDNGGLRFNTGLVALTTGTLDVTVGFR
jgi:hypothetical protein